MKKLKRLSSFLLMLAVMLTFLPASNVQAAVKDIKIISSTEVTAAQAKEWAKSKGATDTFINLADLYWKYSAQCGEVNPGIAYVQAAKETGYGKFGGVLDESFKNPCGMKTSAGGGDTDKDAHQRFNSWEEGIQAHLDHLALYAGADGYPKANTYDPRHFATIKGKAVFVSQLGSNWAPSATYGDDVINMYDGLLKSAGLIKDDEGIKDEATKPGEDSQPEIIKPEDTVAPNGPQALSPKPITNDSQPGTWSSIGWRKERGFWYYYKSDGSKATGWIKPSNHWYYLYSTGEMATGWLKFANGNWYYFNPDGDMRTGWVKTNNTWYYLQGDGSMITGLYNIDGATYYLDGSGAMATSWRLINNQWLYFFSNGSMAKGWIKPYNQWYYLHNNGVMATGLFSRNGETYYLYSSGEMATGWVGFADGHYSYFEPGSGHMLRNTIIDGWKIGADGKRGEKTQEVTPNPQGKLVVVDPGHNFGGDDGAYATHNGITYCERDLNMQVAVKLKRNLEAKGYRVVLTRTESDRSTMPESQSLAARANLANSLNADLFISLHHNTAGTANAYGVETYYSLAQSNGYASKTWATNINNQIVSSTGRYNRGAKNANFYVIKNTNMPAVLVELGFISNPTEALNCAGDYYQNLSAQAIANVVGNGL